MTPTYTTARDELFTLFNAAWQSANAVVGYVPEIRWQGAEESTEPDFSKFWCRVSRQTVAEPQTTFAIGGSPKRYTSYGLVFVQVFAPKNESLAYEKMQQLAQVAKNAFRGKTTESGLWFRNVRVNDNLPMEEMMYRLNVIAEYQYDEIA